MNPEHRAGCEFRVAGRTLSGTALRYGDVSPEHRERFLPGAFAPVPAVPLNLQHDRSVVLLPAERYALTDTEHALEVRAELPADSAALKLVRRGALNGFSVEFHSRSETREAGVRVIERAELVGVALVDMPSYPGSTAEVRRRGDRGGRLATFRGRVPAGRKLDCRCSPGDCLEAIFEAGAFDNLTAGQVTERGRDILAVVGEYQNAIGSAQRRTVRFWQGRDGALEFAVDVPSTARGEALMETFNVVPVHARPVLDLDASDYTLADRVATYRRAEVRALTIGPTDASRGWTPLVIGEDGEGPPGPGTRRESESLARRRALWL